MTCRGHYYLHKVPREVEILVMYWNKPNPWIRIHHNAPIALVGNILRGKSTAQKGANVSFESCLIVKDEPEMESSEEKKSHREREGDHYSG